MAVAVRSAAASKSNGSGSPGSGVTFPVATPAGFTTDDVLLCIIWQDSDGTSANLTTPPGWAQSGPDITSTSTSPFGKVFVKVAAGSEGASVSWTVSGGASTVATMLALTGANTATPINVTAVAGTGSGTAQSAPTIGSGTTPAAGDLLVCSFAAQNGTAHTWSVPAGMTEQTDQSTTWIGAAVDTQVVSAAGATGAKTSTGSVTPSGNWRSLSLSVAQGSSTANITGSDTATGGESRALSASASAGDTATGGESRNVSISFAGADTATGGETYLISTPTVGNEPGTGDDTAGAVAATTTGGDTAAGADTTSLTATPTGGDTATGSDSGLIRLSATDPATGTETQSSTANPAAADHGLGGEGGFYDTAFGDLNLSLWAVDRATGNLSPLPDYHTLTISPVRNAPGAVTVVYPADGRNYALLHNNITADCDLEVEVWLSGSSTGRLRGYLTDTAIDDAAEPVVGTFSGSFLELRMGEVVVFPQPPGGVNGNAKLEAAFNAATAGAIMTVLLGQAQTRGALTDLTADFTAAVDSRGVAWPTVVTTKFSPGATYQSVLDTLVSLGLCEWQITADHVLHLYTAGGRGVDRTTGPRPVILRRGRNITDAPRTHSVRSSATAVLAAGSEGIYAPVADANALARRGRRVEMSTSANNLTDLGSVQAFAGVELAAVAPGAMEITHGLGFLPGEPRPGTVFDVGDWIFSDTLGSLERRRVAQWTLTVGGQSGATPTGTVTLNDTTTDAVSALEAQIRRATNGSAVVGTSTSSVDNGVPTPPTGVVASSTAHFVGSDVQASVLVGWAPPVLNVDGTLITDLAGYTIQYAVGTGPYQFAATITDGSATSGSFTAPPGLTVHIQVRAYDQSGNTSAWSAAIDHTTAKNTTAPPAPSTPVVANYLGVLRITWDGLTATGADMLAAAPNFALVEVHISTASGFTPTNATYFDRLFAAGTQVYTAGTYGVTYYAKLVPVDHGDNRGTPSGQGSDSPQQVVSGDVFAGAVGTAQLADAAITTAKINLLAVNDAQIGNLAVGKLTTGVLSADVTNSGMIRSGTAGQHYELDGAGLRIYNSASALTVRFDGLNNLVTGTLQSALSGQRWVMMPSGDMLLYAPTGTAYSRLWNLGSDLAMRGQLDGSGMSGRVNVNSIGVGINFSAETDLTNLRAEVLVKDRFVQLTSPYHRYQLDGRFLPADGSGIRRIAFLETDSSGNEITSTRIEYKNAGGVPGMVAISNDAGWEASGGIFLVVNAAENAFRDVHASGFVTVSSRLAKRAEADITFARARDEVDLVQRARARQWQYLHDQPEFRPPTPGYQMEKWRYHDDGRPVLDEDGHHLHDMVDAQWAQPPRPAPTHYGPMAEDIEALAPSLVQNFGPDWIGGGKATDVRDLTGVVWGATGILADRLDALEALVATLRPGTIVDGEAAG